MKIQLLSDLHLEVQADWQPTPAPGAELLILAGDIGSYQRGSQLTDAHFGLDRFSPRHGWPTPVVFVPGNHEYDALDFDLAHARLRDSCERLGIVWLERASHEIQERTGRRIRLVGTTLWTDFDALTPGTDASGRHDRSVDSLLTRQLKARQKACRAADYYLSKTGTTRHGEPMLSDAVRAQGLVCQTWLTQTLSEPFDGSTVVVTHFAPSLHSADPRYGLSPGTAGFCNALDHLLPMAEAWLHGHLHAPANYTHHGCRVMANPLGYARKGEQAGFDPVRCIDV